MESGFFVDSMTGIFVGSVLVCVKFTLKTNIMKRSRLLLYTILYLLTYTSSFAQKIQSGDIIFSTLTSYTVFDLSGKTVSQGLGKSIDFNDFSNGMYIVVTTGTRCIVVSHDGLIIGIRVENTETDFIDTDQDTIQQKCSEGFAVRPFYDTASLINYIHARIDHLETDSAIVCELTRFNAEWYPQALHAKWVERSWFYSVGDVFQHFLQIDSMGVCGDQAVYLSNLVHYFLGLRSCAIGMGHRDLDSMSYFFSHVQTLVELPIGHQDTLWAIFDSQNGVAYRDSLGNLIDFRDIFYRVQKPIADEMLSRGHIYHTSSCVNEFYSSSFPFETVEIYESGFYPDSMVATGERSLSFVFRDQVSQDWKKAGESHGFDMDSVSSKQMADMSPLFTSAIWETTNYGPTGIPENLEFARQVREFTGLQFLKKEHRWSVFENYHHQKE